MSKEIDTEIRYVEPKKAGNRKKHAILMVLTGPTAGQTIFLEPQETWQIGRSDDADLKFFDGSISRNHSTLTFKPNDGWCLEDLSSANGTWVNGEKIKSAILKGNDEIQFGSFIVVKFVLQSEEEASFQKELYEAATRDSLTHLHTKRFFMERLESEFNHHLRTKRPLSVIFLDIDHFKKINDSLGHQGGDLVLKQLGALLLNGLRKGDGLGRYGGEEFVLMLRECALEGAKIFAEKLRKRVEDHKFEVEGGAGISVTASFGIATYTQNNFKDVKELLKTADQFLYKAKKNGRNQVACLIG